MASTAPQDVRQSAGVNRWILEPLFNVIYISLLATVFVAVGLTAAGLDGALVVVIVIVLWAAAAVVWFRRRATRHSR
jgi:UDP-N-acetylmuramyl pentapeptide phosphotransferase/UDP-N-acetylglucosamine-1-phosphate transferase